MPTRGRPPKPVEQKRALGNPGRRPLPDAAHVIELEPAKEIPEPSRDLYDQGRELWDRVWTMGSTWISPRTDYELLLVTCEMVDEREILRAKVLATGDARERRGLRMLEQSLVSNLSLLGLTPTDRSRLGVAEVKARSKLEELMARRNER